MTEIVNGLNRDFMWSEIEALEQALGDGNPLGASRVSVRAADLKALLESYDDLVIANMAERPTADEIAALDMARKDMTVVAGRLGRRVQQLSDLLSELDELRSECGPDELGAIAGKRVADFVTRYQAALAEGVQ